MIVHVSPEAEKEASDAAAWHEDRQAGLGATFMSEVREAIDLVRRDPLALSRMEQYLGEFDLRRQRFKRFPYMLIVHCEPDAAVIVAVAHSRQRPLYWLDRVNSTNCSVLDSAHEAVIRCRTLTHSSRCLFLQRIFRQKV